MATATAGGDDGPDERDHEHRSRWPIVGAVGGGLLYVGFALYALATATGYLPPILGGGVAVVGALVLVGSFAGWVDEAFLGRVTGDRRDLYRTTMILFLATDVATFGAGFVYYFFIRAGAWPPRSVPHGLLGVLVGVNTVLLLTSSVTFHLASAALDEGNETRFRRLLAVTFVLGVAFVAGQAYEYYEFLKEGFTLTTGIFGSAFYGLTGLHGLHVTLGAVLVGVVLARAYRGEYGPGRDTSVETVELYWHFVDVVWLFLVVTLYVGATLG